MAIVFADWTTSLCNSENTFMKNNKNTSARISSAATGGCGYNDSDLGAVPVFKHLTRAWANLSTGVSKVLILRFSMATWIRFLIRDNSYPIRQKIGSRVTLMIHVHQSSRRLLRKLLLLVPGVTSRRRNSAKLQHQRQPGLKMVMTMTCALHCRID